jgi:hypothetical protein
MSDIEQRLRDTVNRASEAFEPAADLPARIGERVRHHERRRRLVVGGLTSAAVASAAAMVLVVVGLAGRATTDDDHIRTGEQPGETTPDGPTTSERDTTGSTTSSTTTTSAPTTSTPTGSGDDGTGGSGGSGGTAPPGPSGPTGPTGDQIGLLTEMSRSGIGPIRAGMTVAQAAAATGQTITPAGGAGGGGCFEATIEGVDGITLAVEPQGADTSAGIVRAVSGSVLPTVDGAQVGQSRSELLAALGQPTATRPAPAPWDAADQVLVFEQGGVAYGVLVVDDMVLNVASGDPAWVTTDGCP